ncbi:MAG: nucleotidyltransferase family protein [Candidatus Eremiobacteraeota bacterium]|nr:nucleotidyltransferase family protein [Candidatus Eremiobacteraeota bacterium]
MHDVIILAGGKMEEEFRALYDVEHKAYIPLHGKMMVQYVLEALSGVQELSRKVLVAPSLPVPPLVGEHVDHAVTGGSSMVASLRAGLEALPSPSEKVLVMPSDIPLLTAGAVEEFLRGCRERQGSVCYAYVEKSDSERSYPGLRHTYARLREGTFCGGSLVLLEPAVFPQCERLFTTLTAARKNPFQSASMLGLPIILKFAAGLLSLADLEKKITALLGAPAVAVRIRQGNAAFNIDDLEVLRFAERLLA